ncbi:hypothetical protein CKO31_01900 [Thiohalocapsa halophila]|uniref:Autotransporter domain-containing protein n=1 Tax=Thiohalocapsa halophila TaxID=69359 RepID=A0ABS1CCA6_9GAMM|nr:autotransporter domain-containing protein [Thiohalocapsa halophila]MBK1629509.1 hypothetical protein [Thiohalocapsa halophila]
MHVQRRELTRDTTADNLGFGADTTELAGGGRLTVAPGWLLGGALAYERRNLDVDDSAANSEGDQFQGGLSLTRRWGDTELGGALSLAYGSFDIERAPWPVSASHRRCE